MLIERSWLGTRDYSDVKPEPTQNDIVDRDGDIWYQFGSGWCCFPDQVVQPWEKVSPYVEAGTYE